MDPVPDTTLLSTLADLAGGLLQLAAAVLGFATVLAARRNGTGRRGDTRSDD
ncbi:hypothetical protein [Micromonospora echinofusca]|uniref:Uncharacterized protein n=1 Tax=Micromonospora echinofusca TaxID=47858 RepID=A0ABS3W1B4_MICEH|nr:hypothetical protein [Micromonospora echinofusca]MBO4210409.1 hypothetical protein [Micromonospora echinofusca]